MAFADLTFVDWGGVVAGSGFVLSPILHPQVAASVRTLVGITAAACRENADYDDSTTDLPYHHGA